MCSSFTTCDAALTTVATLVFPRDVVTPGVLLDDLPVAVHDQLQPARLFLTLVVDFHDFDSHAIRRRSWVEGQDAEVGKNALRRRLDLRLASR